MAAQPPPDIEDILTFFDISSADDTLVGSGPGESAEGRMNARRNMLEAAGFLTEDGDYEGACELLWDAYYKTDGDPIPPDFVEGDAADDLAQMILDLISALGC